MQVAANGRLGYGLPRVPQTSVWGAIQARSKHTRGAACCAGFPIGLAMQQGAASAASTDEDDRHVKKPNRGLSSLALNPPDQRKESAESSKAGSPACLLNSVLASCGGQLPCPQHGVSYGREVRLSKAGMLPFQFAKPILSDDALLQHALEITAG